MEVPGRTRPSRAHRARMGRQDLGRRLAIPRLRTRSDRRCMIAAGAITRLASEERLPAPTIERDYVLAQLCADIGALDERRLVFKGGTLLRLCYFADYRYSADLDFSAIEGLTSTA